MGRQTKCRKCGMNIEQDENGRWRDDVSIGTKESLSGFDFEWRFLCLGNEGAVVSYHEPEEDDDGRRR